MKPSSCVVAVPAPNKVLPGGSAVHFGMCVCVGRPPSEGVWESGRPRHDDCDLTGPQMQLWKDAGPELDTACVGALPVEP